MLPLPNKVQAIGGARERFAPAAPNGNIRIAAKAAAMDCPGAGQ